MEQTAENSVDTVDAIVPLTDVEAAADEIEATVGELCENGDIGSYCEAYADTLVRQATEKLDPADIEEGCLQGLETFVPGQGPNLQVGDCVVLSIATGSASGVDCSQPYDGEVTAVFQIGGDEYPGEDAVLREVEQGCASSPTFLYPTKASWNLQGDRLVVCILDVVFSLEAGDCLIYSETLQRVGCSEPYDAEVIDAFDMPGTAFPGDDAVADYVEQNCPLRTDQYFFPTEETWATGDRQIACLDE
jgi:hypothetical protein